MTAPDWTAAFDDLLVERWHACTLCGRPGVHGGIWEVGSLRVMFVFCRAHYEANAASEEALEALLAGRYREGEGAQP
jgi:hypothetical protein